MRSWLLVLLLLPRAYGAEPSPLFRSILERRHLDETALRALGFVLKGDSARSVNPYGLEEGPALTPAQLDERLGALERGEALPVAPPSPIRRVPPIIPALDLAPSALGFLYDGRIGGLATTAPPEPVKAGPYVEPSFDASWSNVEKNFRDPKTRKQALKELSSRFQKDPATPTGLSSDAPEALRLLARELHEGRGGDAAAGELKRELKMAANLRDPQKFEFAAKVASPITVLVALSRSRASHSLESRLYFESMTKTLDAQNRTLSGFLAEQDPYARWSADFLLRAHAYDALVPFLERRPAEAGELGPLLFPAGRADEVRARADALEGLLLQLAVKGRAGGAAARFTKGLIAHALIAPPDQARRIAVYLKLNEPVLPRFLRPSLAALDPLLPPGVLEDAGLTPPAPRESWPTDRWTFAVHFASMDSYRGWYSRFTARGWTAETVDGEPALGKDFGVLHVAQVAKIYQGDDDDFLRDDEADRFLSSVKKDLRDPAVQGVILRTHSQFRISSLFDKKTNTGKLMLDGACRSAWDLRELRKRCPSCQFIVNTGTGRGKLNNDAIIAVVEGLANDLDWSEIGAEFARTSPSTSARIQGPWTPPYAEALRVLEKREKADAKADAGS